MRHRFINDGRSPIPMGSRADYACVCGKRGTLSVIERHIAQSSTEDSAHAAPTAPYDQLVDSGDDFLGGDTKAHYLPMEPRQPAPTGESLPLQRPDRPATPEPLPPPPSSSTNTQQLDGDEELVLIARITGPATPVASRSIAELFQDMLRSAFQAGATAATTGESFETWYQREVLR